MENEISILEENSIRSKIHVIRGQQVMIDRDIAELYGVETRRLNEQVKRNIERFPEQFCFQLTREEVENLKKSNLVKSQFVTSQKKDSVMSHFATSPDFANTIFAGQDGGTRKLPFVFTEQGVAMLSAVLKSDTAIKASIKIMTVFVEMRHLLSANAQLFQKLDFIEKHQIESDVHQRETDKKVEELFTLMDKYNVKDEQGVYFQGQIFDAYAKFETFITQATKEIILIDNNDNKYSSSTRACLLLNIGLFIP